MLLTSTFTHCIPPLVSPPSLSALEELSGMEVLCSDKTGTLTLNKLTLDKEDVEVGMGRWVG